MKINMSVLILPATTPNTNPPVKSLEEYTEQEIANFAAKNTWPHICPSC